MDSRDAAELIAELHEEKAEHQAAERFRNRAALLIAFLAAVLAIGGLGGGNATDDMLINNIRAANTWAFYQAKNVRQTMYKLAVDDLESSIGSRNPATQPGFQERLAGYQTTIDRYESEPDAAAPTDPMKGEGKTQLKLQAQAFEAARDRAVQQDNSFDVAEVALQLALVLGSVAILSLNRIILFLALGLGAVGSILTANGFLLHFPLPL
jgi:hypothetical protein